MTRIPTVTSSPDAGSVVLGLVAHLLVSAAGAWFGVTALHIYRHHSPEFDNRIWRPFVVGSIAIVLYGIVGIWELVAVRYEVQMQMFGNLVFVAFLLALAIGIRQLFHETALPVPYVRYVSRGALQRLERVLAVVIVFVGLGVFLINGSGIVELFFGATGSVVALYGVLIGVGERSMTTMRGTAISSLLRYLVPAIGCAGLISVLATTHIVLGYPLVHADLQRIVLVVVASFLLMATVRLHDLLVSLG